MLLPALALALALQTAAAQPAAPAPKPFDCTAPEYRQFDFWAGDWKVTTPDGKPAGNNTIEVILDGCALSENWRGVKGGRGHSYNAYDRERKVWHQTWVDRDGTVLLLDGGLQDGKMVLSGPSGATLNRITWEPHQDGSVRQLWETSADQGKTWAVAFDGLYRKQKR